MEKRPSIGQFKGQARLPKFAVPRRYDLHLKLDLVACSFSGAVRISLAVAEETKFLVLNALELAIGDVCFADSADQKKIRPCDILLDEEDEILVLAFDGALGCGEGVLTIEFSGMLNAQLKGLYKCAYVDGGEKKYMAATQFEAVDARRCFPCWDEPALKATFQITLDVPPEVTALSNMPILKEKLDGNIRTVYFEESPMMSTYLVAVVVGLFDSVEEMTADGIRVRVYCPPGKSDYGIFALHVAVKALELYTRYFSAPYPLPKLDMVAVPEFSAGAMENYGLIIYRENEMLHDELQSTAAKKQRITVVAMHEVAHQWFGNLVTMEWWTHLWLNEGFATWVSYMATDNLFPEWKVWTQFLQLTANGLYMDSLEKSHPIEVEIIHARAVLEIFDAVSYEKGSAVIRMLQSYLGDAIFQKSLGSYMKRYAWKNAKTEDLWSVLTDESGVDVTNLMDTWTKQKGYPLISVNLNSHILEFEQSQFILSGLAGEGLWIVPITLCLGSYERQKKFHFWIKINIDQSGFYRVKYEDKLAAQLMKAIESNYLSATDKFGILDDSHALCQGGKQSLSYLLTLMDVYRKDTDYTVVSNLINVCYSIVKTYCDAFPDSVDSLRQYFINILLPSAERLGWELVPGEPHLNVLLRGEIFMALASFGDKKTHEDAIRRFESFLMDKNTPLLSADTKRAAYIAVMRKTTVASRNYFESLLSIYREADAVQEKERILRHLAASPDPDIVLEVLNFIVSDEVRDQDIVYGFAGISSEGRETAWKWLKVRSSTSNHNASSVLLQNIHIQSDGQLIFYQI
ncbi:Aminopeptidase [Psidium guajava]|nr:Aminopeptidase [Psidium guajava]